MATMPCHLPPPRLEPLWITVLVRLQLTGLLCDGSQHQSCSGFTQESPRARLLQVTRTWTAAILLSLIPEDQIFGKALKLHSDAAWKLFKGFPPKILWCELSGWLIDLSRAVLVICELPRFCSSQSKLENEQGFSTFSRSQLIGIIHEKQQV